MAEEGASNKIDKILVEQAAQAIINFEKRRRNDSNPQLLEDNAKWIFVEVQLKKAISDSARKPVRISIRHSIFNTEDNHSVCLFCKDSDKEWLEELVESKQVKGLDKVLSLSDVLKYYKQFKNRKQLLSEHTNFVCHASIATHLYNSLGSDFESKNAKPAQIEFSNENFLNAFERYLSSTYVNFSGRLLAVKIGLTSSPVINIIENAEVAVEDVVRRLKHGWKDVSAINLRCQDSTGLPIFSKTDNELLAYCREKITSAGKKRKGEEAEESNNKRTKLTKSRA